MSELPLIDVTTLLIEFHIFEKKPGVYDPVYVVEEGEQSSESQTADERAEKMTEAKGCERNK
jgi:hypothetical protein